MSRPKPTRAKKTKILLSSVFGPYAVDDDYGSRAMNPMELYHNQVTREQGPFSLRMFHRSWGLMLIQANIHAPCVVLDFPTRDRFIQELRENEYDVIGLSAIMPNLAKVQDMCRLIRKELPQATIVIGGHIANIPTLDELVDADIIVQGEGVQWFRSYLGEDTSQTIRHPVINSGYGARTMGVSIQGRPGDTAATIIPSVGCPMGCNFCSTSAMFGGKGKHLDFYQTGDQLFEIMEGLEEELQVTSFFVMDENFLLHRPRALRLLELMQELNKPWELYVFSSANVLRAYSMEELVGLGVTWVWMGLEGRNSRYQKLKNADTYALVKTLQANGIRVLGSSIIGLEEHRPENMDDIIAWAVGHNTEFHQFMLYTAVPGTPLYREHAEKGTLLDSDAMAPADCHGQLKFNTVHPHLPAGSETRLLTAAFQEDFRVNGPSVLRLARTLLNGWRAHRHHPEIRVRQRVARDARMLWSSYSGGLWAAIRFFRGQPDLQQKLKATLDEIVGEFGLRARLAQYVVGAFALARLKREQGLLQNGKTYEPPTFYETNQEAHTEHSQGPRLARWVTASSCPSPLSRERDSHHIVSPAA